MGFGINFPTDTGLLCGPAFQNHQVLFCEVGSVASILEDLGQWGRCTGLEDFEGGRRGRRDLGSESEIHSWIWCLGRDGWKLGSIRVVHFHSGKMSYGASLVA